MRKRLLGIWVALVALAPAAAVPAPSPAMAPAPGSPLQADHVTLWVTPGAPERVALERLGFRIAPFINRHDGQGTASATVEFVNGFLELAWPDSSVPVEPGREFLRDRFRARTEWRTTGRSPVGLVMRRTAAAPDSLPFPTYPLTAPWMPPGSAMLRLTPLTDSLGASLFVSPHELVTPPDSVRAWLARKDPRAEPMRHPNGAREITEIRIVAPARGLNRVTVMLHRWDVVEFDGGKDWLVELTLDRGRSGKRADLRPGLPLVVRY